MIMINRSCLCNSKICFGDPSSFFFHPEASISTGDSHQAQMAQYLCSTDADETLHGDQLPVATHIRRCRDAMRWHRGAPGETDVSGITRYIQIHHVLPGQREEKAIGWKWNQQFEEVNPLIISVAIAAIAQHFWVDIQETMENQKITRC